VRASANLVGRLSEDPQLHMTRLEGAWMLDLLILESHHFDGFEHAEVLVKFFKAGMSKGGVGIENQFRSKFGWMSGCFARKQHGEDGGHEG